MRFLALLVLWVFATGSAAAEPAHLQSVKGDVEVRSAATAPWSKAAEGQAVPAGASVRLGHAASAAVVLSCGDIRLAPDTEVERRPDDLVENRLVTRFMLLRGRLRADVDGDSRQRLDVATALFDVAARACDFTVSATLVAVFDGHGTLHSADASLPLFRGDIGQCEQRGIVQRNPAAVTFRSLRVAAGREKWLYEPSDIEHGTSYDTAGVQARGHKHRFGPSSPATDASAHGGDRPARPHDIDVDSEDDETDGTRSRPRPR